MKLADVSIRRPVFTVMIIAALIVLGYTSFTRMNTDLMPDVDFPYVVVQTIYPGAGAEAIELDVTKLIEDAVNPISGVKHITSVSQEGYSLVFAEFILEKDGMEAAQEVREKVSAIRGDLPEDIEEPTVTQYDPESEPIISVTISGERPLRDITEYVKDDIKKLLEAIPGVGAVTLIGGYEREVNVFLDIDKMESYEIPVDKVKDALAAANLEIPGGRVNESNREYVVRTMGKLLSVRDFDNITIDNPGGQPVYLKDIATVEDGIKERRSLARVDGKEAVVLDISRQSGGNTVDVARAVKAEIERIRQAMPTDLKIDVIVDNSTFIEDSIHDVLTNIYYGGLLAILVVFLFLVDIRSTVITGLAIPVSIIATFIFMKALGFTLNVISLLALAIGVGFLIDDAIVVIENIYRRLQGGATAIEAAFSGTKEIGLAVMATTFTIVVVFLPVAFMKGIVGRFFYQFGMTVAIAVLISLFVAFTLTPMLSSRWLRLEGSNDDKPKTIPGRIYRFIQKLVAPWNRFFDGVNEYYKVILAWALNHRPAIVILAVLTFAFSIFLGGLAGIQFQPITDQNSVIIPIETPPGTDLETTAQRLMEVENLIRNHFEGVELIYTTIGSGQDPVNEGRIYVKLVPKAQRPLSAQLMGDSARKMIAVIPGIEYAITIEEGHGGGSRAAELSIRGNDMDVLTDLTYQVEGFFRTTPGAVDITNSLSEGKPELRVEIDRELANDLGINVLAVGGTVRSLIEGEVVTRFKESDKEYDVRIRLKEEDRLNTAQVGRLLIESQKEIEGTRTFLVPLANLASFEKTSAIGEFNRLDRLREIRVGANAESGAFVGTMTNQVEAQIREKLDVPPGYYITKAGESEILAESFGYMFEALILAVIFIYLILASQYESFFDPLSIMISLPLSMIGAIVALLIMGDSISIISLIGIIMLMGLVTKNGILMIDFVKQRRRAGMPRTDAILQAGPIRLRPILMTTLAMILGMLPVALGIGPGAELRAPMGRAVIGGLISSTILTLVVVPVVYTIIDDIVAYFLGRETITAQPEGTENA